MNTKKNFFILFCLLVLLGVQTNADEPIKNTGKITSFSKLIYQDIGTKTKPGTCDITKKGLCLVAFGADIWGTNDEFRFGYKEVKGDFDMSVQIRNLSVANLYTKAGIMARTDLSDNCQHVYFQVFPDNSPRNHNNGGCEFQYRMVKGGEMKAIYPDLANAGHKFDITFPNTWIRLKRTGNVFNSYISHDNKGWNQYSTFTIEMPEKVFLGIAVTAHDTDKKTTAEFDKLRLKN